MTVVNFLHYIIGDITAKGKSNFSFFPERKMTSYSGKANERKWNFLLTSNKPQIVESNSKMPLEELMGAFKGFLAVMEHNSSNDQGTF